jgi:hypothetical protein
MKTVKVELRFNIPDATAEQAVIEALRQGAQAALATAVLLQPKGRPEAVLTMDDYIEGIKPLSLEDGKPVEEADGG